MDKKQLVVFTPFNILTNYFIAAYVGVKCTWNYMLVPGTGSQNYKIGASFNSLRLDELDILEVEDREILTVHKSESIWFFINTKTNELDQLTFFSPFNEKVLNKVGIGDMLSDVFSNFGKCAIVDKCFEPKEHFGLTFETEGNSRKESAIIKSISISTPFPFYGDMPESFLQNNTTKIRKLP